MVADAVIMAAGAINDATKNKSFVSKNYKPVMSRESNDRVCKVATNEYLSPYLKKQYVKEAQRRRLNCSVDNSKKTLVSSDTYTKSEPIKLSSTFNCDNYPNQCSNTSLCAKATRGNKWETGIVFKKHVQEAKSRGLDCGIKNNN